MGELMFPVRALLRPSLLLLLLASVVASALAYQLPFSYHLNLGTPEAAPHLTNFYPQQDLEGRAARWSHAYSYVTLMGTGGNRPIRVTLDFNPSRLGINSPKPVHVTALAGGEELYNRTLAPNSGWQRIELDVDATHPVALAARDIVLELRTDVYRPPDYQGNELGLIVSSADVQPLPGAPWRPVVPNLRVMLLVLALTLVSGLLAARVGAGRLRGGQTPLTLLISAPVAVLLAVGIAVDPVALALTLPSLLLAVVGAYILLIVLFRALPPLAPSLLAELRAIRRAINYRPLLGALLSAPVLFSFGFQAPMSYAIDVGSGYDAPFLANFNPPMYPMPDGGPGDYRYTSQRSAIRVPGAGSDHIFKVRMRVNPGDGPATRGEVRIVSGATEVAHFRPTRGWQNVEFRVATGSPGFVEASDLNLEVRSPAEVVEGGEQRGIMVDRIEVTQVGGTAPVSRSPAQEAGLLVGILLLYLLVARASGASPSLYVQRLALGLAVAASLVVAAALFSRRVEVTLALPHVLITLLVGYVLVAASRLLPEAWRRGHAASMLPALFSAAFMLRFGFSALPQLQVIDLPYHLKWLRILIGGDFLALYLPGQLSKVPPEWNLDVLIPKSPLFYMAMWPLGLLKGIDLGPSVLLAVCLLDASLVLVLYALVRRLGSFPALGAASFYAVMPLAFRALAFGILPTLFAQALTLYAVAVPVLYPARLSRSPIFIGWTLLVAASLIAFPTALAFNMAVLVVLAVGWRLRNAVPGRTSAYLVGGAAIALLISFLLYYGLYAQAFVQKTLPALASGTAPRGHALWPGGFGELLGWTSGYALSALPILMLPFAVLLLGRTRDAYTARLWVLLVAWLGILLLGLLLNLRFDMIGKHLYYTMPAAAAAGGIVAARLWQRNSTIPFARVLVCLVMVSVLWSALAFIAGRI